MTNRLLTAAVIGAVGAGSAATVATAHQGRAKVRDARVQIATVSSYSSGTLTVKTTDGTTITGAVTRRTRIDCRALLSGTTPTTTPEPSTDVTAQGDDDGGRRGPGRGERLHRGDDDGAVCDTSSLTAGTGVLAASTDLTKDGQRFTRILLVDGSSSSSSDSDYTSN